MKRKRQFTLGVQVCQAFGCNTQFPHISSTVRNYCTKVCRRVMRGGKKNLRRLGMGRKVV